MRAAEGLGLLRRRLEEHAQEQALRQHPPRGDAVADALVERALVGGVLVDDEQSLRPRWPG